jgi:hypothetical protein
VTGEWKKLHNEELHNLYSLPNITRMTKLRRGRWVGYEARIGEKKKAYRLLVRKPQGKRPLGRPRHMWMGNIKLDLEVIRWGSTDWIDLAQDGDS